MKVKIFSIYDSKAAAWLPPFFLPQSGIAIRAFVDCVAKEGHNFNLHPEDYTLALLGEFDDETAKFIQSDRASESLITGLAAVAASIKEKSEKSGFVTLNQSGVENG